MERNIQTKESLCVGREWRSSQQLTGTLLFYGNLSRLVPILLGTQWRQVPSLFGGNEVVKTIHDLGVHYHVAHLDVLQQTVVQLEN
jgi:hypothetical protein